MAFVGSGGEITNVGTNGNGGPGTATITTTGSEITINWDDGGFTRLKTINFTFDGLDTTELLSAIWTDKSGARVANAMWDITGIPKASEPSTFPLVGSGLLGLAGAAKRRIARR